jgi:GAF domain-containing protein
VGERERGVSQLALLDQDAQDFVGRVCEALSEGALSAVLSQVNEYLHTEAISIFVLDSATDELVLQYAANPDRHDILGLRIPRGQGVVGWVVEHNEDLIVPSTNLDPRFFSGVDEKTGFSTHSILCVPIPAGDPVPDRGQAPCRGQVIGAIEALNKSTGYFNADDAVLLCEIGRAVATCLSETQCSLT